MKFDPFFIITKKVCKIICEKKTLFRMSCMNYRIKLCHLWPIFKNKFLCLVRLKKALAPNEFHLAAGQEIYWAVSSHVPEALEGPGHDESQQPCLLGPPARAPHRLRCPPPIRTDRQYRTSAAQS
jgi:hypothetical protein